MSIDIENSLPPNTPLRCRPFLRPGLASVTNGRVLALGVACLLLFSVSGCQAAEVTKIQHRHYYEDDEVTMRLVLRTPEQLTAFYLGREFSQAAIDRIMDTCFVAAIIENRFYDALWLELDNWQFHADATTIPRVTRDYWKQQWREVKLPQRHQSTFGWTLMPEVRDLRLHESVGGNVVIPVQSEPFTLTAHFATGADKKGNSKTIVFEDVTCLTDPQ